MTALKPPRAPRNAEQATGLLEEVARIDGEIASIEANRNAAIAATNAVADALLVPVVARRSAVAGVVEAWWRQSGHALLPKGRKLMELGGCTIGSKAPPTSLAFTHGAFDKAAELLKPLRWAKPLLRVKTEVDKKAAKAALDGARGDELRRLGFSVTGGGQIFVLEAVTQAGTVQAKG